MFRAAGISASIHRRVLTTSTLMRTTVKVRPVSVLKKGFNAALELISDVFVYSSTIYHPKHDRLLPRWPPPTQQVVPRRPYMSVRDMVLGINPSDAEVEQFNIDFPQCKLVKGRYLSPWSNKTEKSFGEVVDYLWNRKQNKLVLPNLEKTTLEELLDPQPVSIDAIMALEAEDTKYAAAAATANSGAEMERKLRVTWIGHATCYFQMQGVRFITDPVFVTCALSEYWAQAFFPTGMPGQ